MKESEFKGFMEIQCSRCGDSIFFRRDFSYGLKCSDYSGEQKAEILTVFLLGLLCLAGAIICTYMLAMHSNPDASGVSISAAIFGTVFLYISWLIFMVLTLIGLARSKFHHPGPPHVPTSTELMES